MKYYGDNSMQFDGMMNTIIASFRSNDVYHLIIDSNFAPPPEVEPLIPRACPVDQEIPVLEVIPPIANLMPVSITLPTVHDIPARIPNVQRGTPILGVAEMVYQCMRTI